MYLTWLGAAGFKLETGEGAVILIDPFLSRPVEATPLSPIQLTDLTVVDEILLTDGRFDHVMDTPALVKQTGAIVHAPGPVCGRLAEAGIPAHNLECVNLGQTKRVGSLSWQAIAIQMNRADTSAIRRALWGNRATLALVSALSQQWPTGERVGYIFQADGLSLLHVGSAGKVIIEVEGLQQPDIALLPVETAATTGDDVIRLTLQLEPKVVIPHHWDDYYPPLSETVGLDAFETALQAKTPSTRVHRPVVGQRIKVNELV